MTDPAHEMKPHNEPPHDELRPDEGCPQGSEPLICNPTTRWQNDPPKPIKAEGPYLILEEDGIPYVRTAPLEEHHYKRVSDGTLAVYIFGGNWFQELTDSGTFAAVDSEAQYLGDPTDHGAPSSGVAQRILAHAIATIPGSTVPGSIPRRMSLHTRPGMKVMFCNPYAGHDFDVKQALQQLRVGHIYTVRKVDVDQSCTYVELEEVVGLRFNSVHFCNIPYVHVDEENDSDLLMPPTDEEARQIAAEMGLSVEDAMKPVFGDGDGVEWCLVSSSLIEKIGYDEANHEIHVALNTGDTYIYSGPTRKVFEDFCAADSIGAFYNNVIKRRYSARKANT